MKTRLSFLLLLSLVLTGMGRGQQPDKSSAYRMAGNALWWDSLSADRKAYFIDGYTTGMTDASTLLHSECMDHLNDIKPGDPNYDAKFKEVMNLCLLSEAFDYRVSAQKLSDGVDEFYKDSDNARIPVHFALQHVRDKLNGKRAPKELDDELADWRKIMNK